MATLTSLSVADLCAEIAGLQWEIALETAQAAYHAAKEDRVRELHKLATSDNPLDRYAARLVREWRKDAR
jgi:predicted RecB family nuclease